MHIKRPLREIYSQAGDYLKFKFPFIYNENNFVLGEENEREQKEENKSKKKLSGYYLSDLALLKQEFGYNVSGDVKASALTKRRIEVV